MIHTKKDISININAVAAEISAFMRNDRNVRFRISTDAETGIFSAQLQKSAEPHDGDDTIGMHLLSNRRRKSHAELYKEAWTMARTVAKHLLTCAKQNASLIALAA